MREYENLIGRRFGKLEVVELLPSTCAGHRRWLCRCDCGNTHVATTGNLKSGHATSCGCNRSPDLSGRVFGKLTVIGRSEKLQKRGERLLPLWECVCECGTTVYRTSDSLSDDKERMCVVCQQKNSAVQMLSAAGFVGGTQVTKLQNMKPSAANTSGYRGVYFHKRQKKWCARLKFCGKLVNLGSFSTFEDAVKARQRGEDEIYGKFLAEMKSQTKAV